MKNYLLLLTLTIAPILNSYAQGTEHGNGGDEEVQFANIAGQVQEWMAKNITSGELDQKLNLTTVRGNEFFAAYSNAVKNTSVLFSKDAVTINGNTRVCRNDVALNRILCNRDEWRKTQGDVRYGIVLHEYLGILGLETNNGDYSKYPISKNILGYAFSVQKYELGMVKNLNSPMNSIALDLRGRFKKARLTEAKALLNRQFTCTLIAAIPELKTSPFFPKFESLYEHLIFTSGARENYVVQANENELFFLWDHGTGIAIRTEDNGNLIVEQIQLKSYAPEYQLSPPLSNTILLPEAVAAQYGTCSELKEVKQHAKK